jgi:hypothetical protein
LGRFPVGELGRRKKAMILVGLGVVKGRNELKGNIEEEPIVEGDKEESELHYL